MRVTRTQLRELIINEIKVDGFDFHNTLEQNIWASESEMDPEVLEGLLEIIDNFIDGLPVEIYDYDVKLTGSIANYNWSKYSDIDLHIQTDFSKIDEDEELVRAYFNSVTALWNLKHEIDVKGYEVELYVENINEDHVSSGVYSLVSKEWLVEPVKEQSHEIDVKAVRKKAKSISDQIKEVDKIKDPDESLKLSEKLKEKIRRMRKSGLQTRKGQYSTGNIAFKVLRRSGDLEKLSTIKNRAYDSLFSID